ncbi:hypothetical protein H6P81_021053 [Aristolochia fimbriata]|uniref:NAD(P)-binding domain-containing protein n=1 Tax=Aristolochia fimbriata TaxID=158543 RepID=A0AAV7DWB6_ARIFI|nr:hypothetical protein H6P81_021053 [Aristolochia fimbriata]
MDLLHLHSPPLTALPSSLSVLNERSAFLSGQALQGIQNRRCPPPKNLKFVVFGAPSPGLVQGKSGPSLGKIRAVSQESPAKEEDIAFVAGATGRVGSRAVRELIKLGFRVRACVRSKQRAEPLVQSVRGLTVDGGFQPVEKLEIVECDLEKSQEIGPAIGNASVVLCCIGASEKEIFDITGPYRIDYMATKNLIDAATVAKVDHFILLTSLGTNKIGFPAAILNLFWGVLIWKRKAEEALLASGLAYTIVRPGGMERPTDSFKETHNLVLSNEDTLFGGLVSNLQVAELMTFMAKNRSLSFCKVVEVIAETSAPLTPMGDLLEKIPSQRVDTSVQGKLPSSQKLDPPSYETPAPEPPNLEPVQAEAKKPSPLSPYTSYEEFKPPTSPTPIPSTSEEPKAEAAEGGSKTQVTISEPASGDIQKLVVPDKIKPLSPYAMYEDLKPPTSPSPSPSSTRSLRPQTSSTATVSVAEVSPSNESEVKSLQQKSQPLSPFTMYADLKPPTSPSPSPPSSQNHAPQASSTTTVNAVEVPPANESEVKLLLNQQNSRPLSPFTMYEDLKPPSSPTPSA